MLPLLLVFAIPILGIALAGYKEWLKFQSKQQELGTSTQEVEATIQSLQERLTRAERERDALVKRIQNLETIVTSDAWDALQDPTAKTSLPYVSDPLKEDSSSEPSDPESETQSQAEELARRLRR